MKRSSVVVAVALLVSVMTVWAAPTQAAPPPTPTPAPVGEGVIDAIDAFGRADVVVMLRSTPPGRDVAALRRAARDAQDDALVAAAGGGLSVGHRFQTVPALTMTVTSEAALRRLAARPNVVRIDPDIGAGTGSLTNAAAKVGADDLRAAGITGAGTTVAVLDSGWDSDHPDLEGAAVDEACFGTNSGTGFCPNGTNRQVGAGAAEDDAGHGTHVAGIVTSNGVQAPPGIAPDAAIVPVKVLDNCSFSGCFYSFNEITAALDYLVTRIDLGIDAVNMSLGTNALFAGDCDDVSAGTQAAAAAVANLRAQGILSFASAGNNGSTTSMGAPACLSGVVSVGATDNSDVVASFSNTSATTDILAPGVSVVSSLRGGGTISLSGTSMASPVAAGCAALLTQISSTASDTDKLDALKTTGTPITRGTATFPRINCDTAAATLPADPTVSIGDAAVVEGDTGKSRTVTFSVHLSEPAGTPVTVGYDIRLVTGPIGAQANDLKVRSGTVKFKTGITTRAVNVVVYPDTEIENQPVNNDGDLGEVFEVVLRDPPSGYRINTLGDRLYGHDPGPGAAVGVIIDDDPPSGLHVDIGDTTLFEGTSRAGSTKVWVTLSDPAPAQGVTVTVSMPNVVFDFGRAKLGKTTSRTVTFKGGQSRKAIAIKAFPNAEPEPDFNFPVFVTVDSGPAAVGRGLGIVSFRDDD